jgi:hypothetical protein
MLRKLAYGVTLSIHYNSKRKERYIPYSLQAGNPISTTDAKGSGFVAFKI